MRESARTLGGYPETDDYIDVMANGVEEQLAGYDWQQTLRHRDQLVVQLLVAKNGIRRSPGSGRVPPSRSAPGDPGRG
jgi:carnitine 3-dehydrogenase